LFLNLKEKGFKMNEVISEETIYNAAYALIGQYGSLYGQSWENTKNSLMDILHNQNLNALLSLLDEANQTGYNTGYYCAIRKMEENS
jgi:hypothetical protein